MKASASRYSTGPGDTTHATGRVPTKSDAAPGETVRRGVLLGVAGWKVDIERMVRV